MTKRKTQMWVHRTTKEEANRQQRGGDPVGEHSWFCRDSGGTMKNVRKANARKTGNNALENLHPTGEAWISERTGPGSVHVRGPRGWWSIPQVSSALWTRAQLLNAPRRERSVHHRISRSGGWCHSCPSPLQRLLWSPKEFMKPSSWLDSIKPPRKDSALDSHYFGCWESALTPLGFPRLHSSGSLLTLPLSRQRHVTWV